MQTIKINKVDVITLALSLNKIPTKDLIDYVLANYNESSEEAWYIQLEDIIYQYLNHDMNYKLNILPDGGMEIITNDGGVATIDCIEGNYSTTYYQSRLTDMPDGMNMWEYLAEGKAYVKDWDYDPTPEEAIEDALNWLGIKK